MSNSQVFANTIESLMHAMAEDIVKERLSEVLKGIDWSKELEKRIDLYQMICDKIDLTELLRHEVDWNKLSQEELMPKALLQFRALHELSMVKAVVDKSEVSIARKYDTFWKRLCWFFRGS